MSSSPNGLKLQSTANILAAAIRDDIIAGSFFPGEALPQEEISSRYGVSRSPLREALRQLEAEGWIVYLPNRGAFVAHLTAKDVREIYQVRRILEVAVIRDVVKLIDDQRISTVRGLDVAMRRAEDTTEAIALHARLHETVYGIHPNKRLTDDISAHRIRVQQLPNGSSRFRAGMKRIVTDHHALIEALRRRDVRSAERAVLDELKHVEAALLENLP